MEALHGLGNTVGVYVGDGQGEAEAEAETSVQEMDLDVVDADSGVDDLSMDSSDDAILC